MQYIMMSLKQQLLEQLNRRQQVMRVIDGER